MKIKTTSLLFVLLTPVLTFTLSLWIDGIARQPGEDIQFHLLSMETGISNPTEPLWGILAPYFSRWFPDDPILGGIVITYALFIFGMLLNGFSRRSVLIVSFSPALVYMTAQALRQGIAIGIFLVTLGILQKLFHHKKFYHSRILLLIPTFITVLIHNAIIITSVWLLIAYSLEKVRTGGYALKIQLLSILTALVLVIFSPAGQVSGTALLLVVAQISLFIYSLMRRSNSFDCLQISTFILFCVVGFTLTNTGIRVLFQLGVLMPLVFGDKHVGVQLSSLYVYPLTTSFLSFGNAGLYFPDF